MSTDDATARGDAPVDLPVWQQMGLGVLAGYVPAALVDQVLTETGRMQQRTRRLPARVTVWFILALTLFSDQGYQGVWRQLAHCLGQRAPQVPSSSAFTQARRRVGVAVLAELFARLRGAKALAGTVGAFVAGLRLVSWDASMLDVADSKANSAGFIRPRNRTACGGFPKVRLLKLIEVGTHAVIDAAFGACSEQMLARRLLGSLEPGMLLLGDRNFPSWRLWQQSAGTGAHLLWRVKASMLLPRVGTFPDGSYLAVLPKPVTGRRVGIWVRVIEYTVTVTTTDPATATTRTRTELFRLITTITDPRVACAAELAGCYQQRWESETGYKALKVHQRGAGVVLRSQDPDGVQQELYAYLITYQAIRTLMCQAATTAHIDSDRLSFTTTLRAVRRWITSAATATGDLLAAALAAVITDINQDQHERRRRTSPRAVKRPVSPYPSKRNTTQQASTPADYHIEIIPR